MRWFRRLEITLNHSAAKIAEATLASFGFYSLDFATLARYFWCQSQPQLAASEADTS